MPQVILFPLECFLVVSFRVIHYSSNATVGLYIMIEEFLGIIVLFVSIHNVLHAAVLLFCLYVGRFNAVLCHCLFIMSSYFTDVFTLFANQVT